MKNKTSFASIVIFLLVVFFLVNDYVEEYLIYDVNAVNNFQFWRFFSANFLHTNLYHMLLNLSAFILIYYLYENNFSFELYIFLFISLCFSITISIYFFSKEIIYYVGLSGVLHGLLIYSLYLERTKVSYFMIILVYGKVLYEQIIGSNREIEILIDAKVAVDAHFYGVLIATFLYLINYKILRKEKYFS